MESRRPRKTRRIRRSGTLGRLTVVKALFSAACVGLAACGSGSTGSGSAAPGPASSKAPGQTKTIKIAALAFPEGQLMANVYALALQNAGFKTELVQTQGRETA